MRLWHKDLISVLPRQQLLSQWRECCAIASRIKSNGTPGHILVNEISNYPTKDFVDYTELVLVEMKKRGYKISNAALAKFRANTGNITPAQELSPKRRLSLFYSWHNFRYLQQCFYNLEEKYDRGGITEDEWEKLRNHFNQLCGSK